MCVPEAGGSGPAVTPASGAPGARGQGQPFPELSLSFFLLQSWDLARECGGWLFSGCGIKAGLCCDGGGHKGGHFLSSLGCEDAEGRGFKPEP